MQEAGLEGEGDDAALEARAAWAEGAEPGSDEARPPQVEAPPDLRRAERPASPDEAPPTNAAIYFRDISGVTLLSAEEEIELAQQIEVGEDARRELGARTHAPESRARAARRSSSRAANRRAGA